MRSRIARHLAAVALVLLCALAPLLAAMAARPQQAAGDFGAIDAYVAARLREDHIPGAALAITRGDQVVHLRGFGAARPDGTIATPETLFIIGSMSKSITALAVMQLVEAGAIELDAPVQRYLPWFRVADPDASARITVRHLLTHSSGLPEAAAMEAIASDEPLSLEGRVRTLRTVELVAPPGSSFQYANADYLALALVIAATSGQSYEDYVRAHILAPLAMRHTAFSTDGVSAAQLATGHRYWFGLPLPADLPYPQDLVPAGYILASAEDLAHFLIAQLNEGRYGDAAVLSPAGIAAMQQPAMQLVPTIGYGSGWWVGPYNGQAGAATAFYHGGSTPQFRTYMLGIPEGHLGVVILLNANSDLFRASLNDIPEGVADLLTGRPLPARGPSFEVKYLLFDLALLAVTALQLRVAASLLRDRCASERTVRQRVRQAVPLLWEFGLGLGVLLGLPNLGRAPWLAARVGVLVGVPSLGDLPWALVLSLFPDLGFWMLGFAVLLLGSGLLRAIGCLAPPAPGAPARAAPPGFGGAHPGPCPGREPRPHAGC